MAHVKRDVTMETIIHSDGVLYTVVDGDPGTGDHGDAREVWRADVPFGSDKKWRAGGPAFVAAAREQEKQAMQLLARQEEANGHEEN